ncbi:MAG: hypothetical protein KJ018_14735 [Burkholderiales bacterium]|nr:hypothetical protein [Burkholderiales bacterium]
MLSRHAHLAGRPTISPAKLEEVLDVVQAALATARDYETPALCAKAERQVLRGLMEHFVVVAPDLALVVQ